MLDAIERELVESKTDYIRIDGSVSSLLRQEYVRRFQSVDSCKVAVLSMSCFTLTRLYYCYSIFIITCYYWLIDNKCVDLYCIIICTQVK